MVEQLRKTPGLHASEEQGMPSTLLGFWRGKRIDTTKTSAAPHLRLPSQKLKSIEPKIKKSDDFASE
jgi:hypothetical protein